MTSRLQQTPLDTARLIAETADAACGALVVFQGTVRSAPEDGGVVAITYRAYEPVCERVLAELEQEILDEFGLRHCRIVHRVGRLAVGETSVAIVVRAGHRAPAWDAARHALERLKARAPIWKEEHLDDGTSRYVDGIPLVGGTGSTGALGGGIRATRRGGR